MDIKKGDIVICINNGIEDDTISKPMLTLNKGYVVIEVEKWQSTRSVFIKIKNDLDISYEYYSYRFRSLSEYRKLKLERLGIISK